MAVGDFNFAQSLGAPAGNAQMNPGTLAANQSNAMSGNSSTPGAGAGAYESPAAPPPSSGGAGGSAPQAPANPYSTGLSVAPTPPPSSPSPSDGGSQMPPTGAQADTSGYVPTAADLANVANSRAGIEAQGNLSTPIPPQTAQPWSMVGGSGSVSPGQNTLGLPAGTAVQPPMVGGYSTIGGTGKDANTVTSAPLAIAANGAQRPDGVPDGAQWWSDYVNPSSGLRNYGFTPPTAAYSGNDVPAGGAPLMDLSSAMGQPNPQQSTRDQLQTPQQQQPGYNTVTGQPAQQGQQGSTGNIPGQPMPANTLGIPGGVEPDGAPAGTPSNTGTDPSLQQNQIQGATQTTGQLPIGSSTGTNPPGQPPMPAGGARGTTPTNQMTLSNDQLKQLLASGVTIDQIQKALSAGVGTPGYTPPNSYGGPFNAPPGFTPATGSNIPTNMFSGNNGPSQYPEAGLINGFGEQPTLSPALTSNYFQFLNGQVGQGATPYGQQMVFNPSTGQMQMQGLTAGVNPQLQFANNSINSSVTNQANSLPNINALRSEYNPLIQGAQNFQQNGGMGAPGAQLGLQAQYGATGNSHDPTGLYTGAQSLQGAASGTGLLGAPGQYLNSATNTGGYGTPGNLQTALASSGQLGGQGGQTLQDFAQNGQSIDQTPAWQASIAAMQRQRQQQQAQIAEHAAQSGNLAGGANGGGTGYNQAMTDFNAQTNLQDNALLLQAQNQASEAAKQRQLSAAGLSTGQQTNALSQLGQQQATAAQYGAGTQLQSANALQQYMQGANQTMNQNQLYGLGLGGQLTGQSQTNPYGISNQSTNTLGTLNNQAANMGQYYQGMDQNAINANLNEFLRTRPEYSPLLQQQYSGAVTQPGVYNQSSTSGLGAAIGGLAGNAFNTIYQPGGLGNPYPTTPSTKPPGSP